MSVALARVDDRLIHGQVVVGWSRAMDADHLIVANDAVAADPMQRTLLPMAVPPHIKVSIFKVREAAEMAKAEALPGLRAILLFGSLIDAELYQRAGGPLPLLNIGGIRMAPGRKVLRTAVALGEEEIMAARALIAAGSNLSIRMVPGDSEEALAPLLEQEGLNSDKGTVNGA